MLVKVYAKHEESCKNIKLAWVDNTSGSINKCTITTRNKTQEIKSDELGLNNESFNQLAVLEFLKGKPTKALFFMDKSIPEKVSKMHFQSALPNQTYRLMGLWKTIFLMKNETLKKFIISVMSDDKIAPLFYKARGSLSFHHSYIGGLFDHSYDVAMQSRFSALANRLGSTSIDCAFVIGLLHDIGKINMYYNKDLNGNLVGLNTQHEALSFMILNDHFDILKSENPVLFEAVANSITARTNRPMHNEYVVESIVRNADYISAEINQNKMAFKGKPNSHYYADFNNQKRYKRLDYAN